MRPRANHRRSCSGAWSAFAAWKTIARIGQVQRGIQFREVRATEAFFREITPNLNLDRIYLLDRDGRIITEYPRREKLTEFLPDAPLPTYQVRPPFAWIESTKTDQFLVTALVRHPIERSMLGYVVLERQITQSFVDRIAQQADADWLVTSDDAAIHFVSRGLWQGGQRPLKTRINSRKGGLSLAKQSARYHAI